jgi:signal transduction histidine kinase/CheY-like chemotaxis protein
MFDASCLERFKKVPSQPIILVTLVLVLGGWMLAANRLSSTLVASRLSDMIAHETMLANQRVDALALNLGQNLAQMHGIPAAVANEKAVVDAVAGFSPRAGEPALPPSDKARAWLARPDLAELNRHFEIMAAELNYDIIFAIDRSGNCIASSNYGENDRLIGTNFSDREYFREGMKGVRAQQYAVGRATNIPGLFFSAPVFREGAVIGVIATKINLPRLQHWVADIDAFITDANGIVILSHDPAMVMKSIDPAKAAALPESTRMARYKLTRFAPLEIVPVPGLPVASVSVAGGDQHGLVRLGDDNTPSILAQRSRPDDNMTVHSWSALNGIEGLEKDAHWAFVVIFVGGAAVILLFLGSIVFVVSARRHVSQLREKEHAANLANVAKSEFLANMSHEIRTPMNAVIGFTHLALNTELDAKQRDYMTKIKTAATTLLSIINDILDFSKIEAGKLNVEHINFDLRSVLDSVANISSLKAIEKNLELCFNIDDDVPIHLIGDPLRLGQVLLNLLNNAIKFTGHGEVVLAIGVRTRHANTVELAFYVRDTGIGMTEEQQARLFQAFNQADASTTRRFGGSGLGLVISRRITELMGGGMEVVSAPEQGSIFTFTAIFDLQKGANGQMADGRMDVPVHLLAGLRVLVVDDNPTAREILESTLRSWSMPVETVGGGWEAYAALLAAADHGAPIDLVLLDWQMPDPDGLKTAHIILGSAELATKPHIIMISAYTPDHARAEAEHLGVDAFLVKPVDKSLLLETIGSIFVRNAHRPATAPPVVSGPRLMARLRGAHVLLAEDNDINRQIAIEFLGEAGVTVDVAVTGREAVAKALAGDVRYDGVLMDVQMPEMDGLEATRHIRAQRSSRELPIIAMTAHAMEQERRHCLDAGMDDHIAKPIDPQVLLETLVRWIAPSAPPPAIAATPEPPPPEPAGAVSTVSAGAGAGAGAGLPEHLPPFDLPGAVARMSGKRDLVKRVVVGFHNSYGDAAERLDRLFAEGQTAEVERLAHTLKGLAATLGAKALTEASAALEEAMRRGDGPAAGQWIDEVKVRLAHALTAAAQVATVAGTQAPATTAAPLDHAAVQAGIAELRARLAKNSPKARQALATLSGVLAGHGADTLIAAVGAALERFDFRAADAALTALSEHLSALRAD